MDFSAKEERGNFPNGLSGPPLKRAVAAAAVLRNLRRDNMIRSSVKGGSLHFNSCVRKTLPNLVGSIAKCYLLNTGKEVLVNIL
jgi:hypothetical protein